MKSQCIGMVFVAVGAGASMAACGASSTSGPDDGNEMAPTIDAGGGSSTGHDSSTAPEVDGGVAADGSVVQSDASDASTSGSWADSGLGGTTDALGTISGSPAVARLLALTRNCTAANAISSHPGDFVLDDGTVAHVCSLPGGPGNVGGAVFYTADMDIDCDGIRTANCPGSGANMDPSWDNATSFAGPNSADNAMGQPALASENTPYVVIPEEVVFPGLDQNNGGNIVAVIYNDQIEFAVFGDQIAAEPNESGEDIGEASVRTAKGLGIPASPATGGVGGGVTYIAFAGTGSQPADMENIAEIQALGAKLTESLLDNNP